MDETIECMQEIIYRLNARISALFDYKQRIVKNMKICKYPGCSNIIPAGRSRYCCREHMLLANAGKYFMNNTGD